MKVLFMTAVLAASFAVATPAPAAADESQYLRLLDYRWPLSREQLLAEGYRACAANDRGGIHSKQAVDIVNKDLAQSSAEMALEIVIAANAALC